MKIPSLKKLIKNDIFLKIAIVAILILVALGSFYFKISKSKQLSQIKDNISSLESQIQQSTDAFHKSEQLYQQYKLVDKKRLPDDNGYNTARDRLSVALPMIQKLKDIYLFKKLNITLGEIAPMQNNPSSQSTPYDSKVTLEFSGPTDQYVYSFINDLKHILPGYLNVSSLKMEKNNGVDPNAVSAFYKNKEFTFTSGSVEFHWTTLMNNSAKPAAPVDGGAPQ